MRSHAIRSALGYDRLWRIAGLRPGLDIDFSRFNSIDQISGLDLTTFTRASSGWAWNGSAFVEYASGLPRYAVDPATGVRGVLIEEGRTNICARQDLSNPTSWGQPLSATISSIGPEFGCPGPYLITEDGLSGTRRFTRNEPSWAASTTYTISAFFSPVPGAPQRFPYFLLNAGAFGQQRQASINLLTGETWTNGTPITISAVQLASNLWRVSVTSTTTTSANTQIQIAANDTINRANGSFVGANAPVMRVFWPQFEIGAFPTSPIITAGSSLARAADVMTITGANFSSWYNQPQGTFRIEHLLDRTPGSTGAGVGIFAVDDGSQVEAIELTHRLVGTTGLRIRDGGVTLADFTPAVSAPPAGTLQRHVVAYAQDNSIAGYNGVLVDADTSCTMPTPDRVRIGFTQNSGQYVNGIFSKLTYWNARLSDSVSQAIITP